MSIKLYYFPVHAEFCDQAPLYFQQPHPDWQEFTEEVARTYPNCKFYVDIRDKQEIKQSCENLKSQLEEFNL
jgi:hypothetical protein